MESAYKECTKEHELVADSIRHLQTNYIQMKKIIISLLFFWACISFTYAQQLLIRADDIGSSHAANIGVIKSYTDGIARSAELMIVAPWAPEGVKMLIENPGYDVGLHITLTSEWENIKWRPLTHCPSLTDEYGYFLPFIFPNSAHPGKSLTERKESIVLSEVEAELRAQIELTKKMIPTISHLSGHMGWALVSPEKNAIADRLADEYNLPFFDGSSRVGEKYGLSFMSAGWGLKPNEREAAFIQALDKLEKGKTYLYVEHPAIGGDEMKAFGHKGYENVSEDRQSVVELFTNSTIKDIIEKKGIRLVSYGDLIRENKN